MKVKQLINSSALLLQERDLELELGDDYILDLQSKGCSVLGVPGCPHVYKGFRAMLKAFSEVVSLILNT